jgi:hypothetical protein
VTWAWIITLQWNSPLGVMTDTADGVITQEQAASLGTRIAVLAAVMASSRRSLHVPDGPVVVLFYSLEPDVLPTGPGGLL